MGHVLKANQVRIDEPLRLSISDAAAPGPGGPRQAHGQPRVRLAETNPDFAVIEIACSCGAVTYVRCDYTLAGGAPASAESAQP
jgi:hypothetical protein